MANGDGDSFKILVDCFERGRNRGNQDPSISMVPVMLRGLSPTSFDPRVVSIGPLHKKDENDRYELDGLKESYLFDLFNGLDPSPEQTLKACLQKVNDSLPRIRASYGGGMKSTYTDANLAQMMVMDGCFILEFCCKHFRGYDQYLPNKMQNVCIAIDLFLLENQIPFFVLQDIFDCTIRDLAPFSLTSMIYQILGPYIHIFGSDPESDVATDSAPPHHILGCLHKCYRVPDAKPLKLQDVELSNLANHRPLKKSETKVHSVVELDRSGVNFMPYQENDHNWPMNMKFDTSMFGCSPLSLGKPTLLMPTLVIDDVTEIVLRNFIAYEQSFSQVPYYFTSYACVMDMLIDTEDDIRKLVESKALVNNLGSNKDAADMINGVCKGISLSGFYYTKQLKQLDDYYNGTWPKYIAWLRRTYFSSPWNIIALFAGIVLFFLTVAQTVFAILAL